MKQHMKSLASTPQQTWQGLKSFSLKTAIIAKQYNACNENAFLASLGG
jgi:hypothetical protein